MTSCKKSWIWGVGGLAIGALSAYLLKKMGVLSGFGATIPQSFHGSAKYKWKVAGSREVVVQREGLCPTLYTLPFGVPKFSSDAYGGSWTYVYGSETGRIYAFNSAGAAAGLYTKYPGELFWTPVKYM